MVMFILAIGGVALVVATAARVMKRSNSRTRAILLGTLIAPVPALAGAMVDWLLAPAVALRTGGAFAIGMSAIFLAGLMVVVGGLMSAAIALAMKEEDPEDVCLRNLETDPGEPR